MSPEETNLREKAMAAKEAMTELPDAYRDKTVDRAAGLCRTLRVYEAAASPSAILALLEKAERCENAIRWANGELDDFPLQRPNDGHYWWRPELMARAKLKEPT